jgi:glycosyltransferase involved in cell wall biosynthesis
LKKSRRLIVLSPVNPLRAYSGVKYLCDALIQRDIDLELWAYIPKNMLHETSGWRFPVRSFLNTWYGAIPKFRVWASKLQVLFLGLTTDSAILFTDLAFVKQIALMKKLRSRKVLIHYCTEFFTTEEEPQARGILQFYQQFANIPDLVIEVEPNRAKLRKEWYHLARFPLVIPNSIPKSEIPPQSQVGGLAKLAGIQFPAGVPVLLYSGGVYFHRELDLLVDALAEMRRRPFFLAFCYGDAAAIADLRQKCAERLGLDQAKICDAVPRSELLACIHEADAGYVYYRPSLTIGNVYAAPTKLFEYIAVGLPVIASNNPEIVKLIDEGGLGVCVKDEGVLGLRDAIESLLFDNERLACVRERQREKFESELCYEVAAKTAIQAIIELLDAKA